MKNINFYISNKVKKATKIRNPSKNITPAPGCHMGKWQNTIEYHKREPRSQPFFQQVTTRQQWTDAKVLQTQDINKANDPQKKYRIGTVSKSVLLEGLFCASRTLISDMNQYT